MNYKIVDLTQGSDEWKKWRREKIGASDTPIIMGESPWRTPHNLWLEKALGQEQKINYAMQRGTSLENAVRSKHSAQMGKVYVPVCVESVKYPWLSASLDGAFFDEQGKIVDAIEIKCPGEDAHLMAISGKVPPYYEAQLQHQMLVCDLEWIYYVSWDGNFENQPIYIKIYFDETKASQLLQKTEEFYESVKNGNAPKLTAKDEIHLHDESIISLSNQVADLQSQIDYMQEMLDEKKKALIDMLDAQGLTNARAGILKMSKFETKGTIDYKAIPELKQIDLEKYRKESRFSWRFTLNR